jgi:dTDP-4-amino-4,6-dideoxygalactose transaminase
MSAINSIPFARPWITDQERDAVTRVLRGDILTHGPENEAFEQEFGRFIGGDVYCVAVSSCMAALHLSYLQLGIGAGDEVLVPAQTHVATAHAVELVGARPVFVDCEVETGNVRVERLREAITPQTRAISLVHFVGIPCDMDAIMAVAEENNLQVIEDCALAVGTRYAKKHVGLFGTVGCFSFYPVKHMTTGDGGMLITTDPGLATKVKKARGFGVDRTFAQRCMPGIYDVPTLGLNYRMSDINAALGRVQLQRINEILCRRQVNFTTLERRLDTIENVLILRSQKSVAENSHYCLSVVLQERLANRRNEIVLALRELGVGTSVYYPQPVPRMTYYREKYGYDPDAFPNATAISDCGIALPVGPHLQPDDMEYIADRFLEVIQELK